MQWHFEHTQTWQKSSCATVTFLPLALYSVVWVEYLVIPHKSCWAVTIIYPVTISQLAVGWTQHVFYDALLLSIPKWIWSVCSAGGLYFLSVQFSKVMCAELIMLNIIFLLHPCFAVLCNIVLYAFAHQNGVIWISSVSLNTENSICQLLI